ncbi:unnamed protein product [Rotaria sordida]|uniref:Uncharacterized protein n=1 Tax=Rotaria sordida TaxID=392033 RepID=A0A815PXX2_9BILA|nr:unnamed protein product [Rotaria sordida]CAF1455794.1 unnamed protein product [Rotaria sordida]
MIDQSCFYLQLFIDKDMITNYFIGFLLINLINSNPFNRNRCDVCNLTGDFIPSNGYQCFISRDDEIICTCPDNLQSTINRPCRICHRENICGPSDALCSEEPRFFNLNNKKSNFACFCSSGIYLFDKKCPQEINPSTTETSLIDETTSISMSTTTFIQQTITTDSFINQTNSDSISTIFSTEETTIPFSTTSFIPISSINPQQETTESSIPIPNCRSVASYIFIKKYFFILLNIVYFLNK